MRNSLFKAQDVIISNVTQRMQCTTMLQIQTQATNKDSLHRAAV